MQYAVLDNERSEAFPSGRAECPTCGAEMVAKCGPRIMHHWAHLRRRQCDPWWENETPWHREWKNLFPSECREISHTAPDGEIHRADIKTPTGIVIEVQHSFLTDAERLSREAFYGNLVWVVDGTPFRQNFEVLHILPDPASELAQDLVWFRARRDPFGESERMFWRRSENPHHRPGKRDMVEVHTMREVKQQVEESYRGHHQYTWIKPRRTWLEATCPVYIDFGSDWLLKLENYGGTGLPCVHYVAKRKFVHDATTERRALDIAKRFYPIAG